MPELSDHMVAVRLPTEVLVAEMKRRAIFVNTGALEEVAHSVLPRTSAPRVHLIVVEAL